MWIIILFNIVKIEILQGKYYYGGRERERERERERAVHV